MGGNLKAKITSWLGIFMLTIVLLSTSCDKLTNPHLKRGYASAAEIDIDFLVGKLNGKDLSSLTIDSVTDMLGRPSQSNLIDGQAQLVYESDGIKFYFEKNSTQISSLDIYLVAKNVDHQDRGEEIANYSAFHGKLPNGMNGEWKVEQLLKSFKKEGAIDTTDHERLKTLSELGMKGYYPTRVEIPKLKHRVRVEYEYQTKFLNQVSIVVEGRR